MELTAIYKPEKVKEWKLRDNLGLRDRGLSFCLSIYKKRKLNKNDTYDYDYEKILIELDKQQREHKSRLDKIFSVPGFNEFFLENGCDVTLAAIEERFGESLANDVSDYSACDYMFKKSLVVCNGHLFDPVRTYKYKIDVNGKLLEFGVSDFSDSYPEQFGDKLSWWNWCEDVQHLSGYLYIYLTDKYSYNTAICKALDKYASALSCLDQSMGEGSDSYVRMERLVKLLEKKGIIKRIPLRPDYACGQWSYRAKPDGTIELCLVDKQKLEDALAGKSQAINLQKEFILLLENEDIDFDKNYYLLLDKEGKPYFSNTPGKFGGHKKLKIYGRLDCPSALKYLAKGQYAQHRVFFADEETAIAAGYRPCSVCMKERYKIWKAKQENKGAK